VTVRRLTSGNAYAVRDLTGIDIKVGVDARRLGGGEGFTNFGDVQLSRTNVERYPRLQKVADHAPSGRDRWRSPDAGGQSGAVGAQRINSLRDRGFRVVSGEGGRPFGLDRYGKAFYVSWYYKHRVALGDPTATIRGIAAKEGITGRFADHIWMVVNKANTGYPTRETVTRWANLPPPTRRRASLAKGRGGTRPAVPHHVAELVLRARRPWPAAPATSPLSRRRDPESRWSTAAHAPGGPRRSRARRGGDRPDEGTSRSPASISSGVTPVVIWATRESSPRRAGRTRHAAAPEPPGTALPVRSSTPAGRAPDDAAKLAFGTSPDGT
jgi:hypothetical protein